MRSVLEKGGEHQHTGKKVRWELQSFTAENECRDVNRGTLKGTPVLFQGTAREEPCLQQDNGSGLLPHTGSIREVGGQGRERTGRSSWRGSGQ